MTENSKISVDSTFSFEAMEANRNHRIDINSGKGRFKTKKRVQTDFLYNKIGYEIKACQNLRNKKTSSSKEGRQYKEYSF